MINGERGPGGLTPSTWAIKSRRKKNEIVLLVLIGLSEELSGEQLDVRDVAADLVHVVVFLRLLEVELERRRRAHVLLTDNT